MKTIKFSVDSALLRELGERLVGRPHIALAELIKNSYDADATAVIIQFGGDCIEVVDNGHGMTLDEFTRFWMRIGSAHKDTLVESRTFRRPLTGSKGIGRLSVQFLARSLELRTVSALTPEVELAAAIDWREAVTTGDLTEVEVGYQQHPPSESFPESSASGTRIVLRNLNHTWSAVDFRELAGEIRTLQPPFRPNPRLTTDQQRQFTVSLKTERADIAGVFETEMKALLGIWTARIVGQRDPSRSNESQTGTRLDLQFADGSKYRVEYEIPGGGLGSLDFEIRVFNLSHRQPHGIKVEDARRYFNTYGGVHVYDGGFHLPYYGPDTDWLRIEMAHSHRLSRSQLLPEELQVPEGLNFLPTNSRLFGVVNVDTSLERRRAVERGPQPSEHLEIQVTRDRLVDNRAFDELRAVVRWALDYYAMREAQRQFAEAERRRPVVPVKERTKRLGDVLAGYREKLPRRVYESLREEVRLATEAAEAEADALARQVALLGTLATAGMAALAYEHEATKQFQLLERLKSDLEGLRTTQGAGDLDRITIQVTEWIERARATRALFTHLLETEERDSRRRLRARKVVEGILEQTRVFLRGIATEVAIEEDFLLPHGRYSEWTAILQNLSINAANAMLDADRRVLRVSSLSSSTLRAIQVEDTGVGVDLRTAEKLFKPFARRIAISPERRALGFGGSGLGLTIVRMLASTLDVEVTFVRPSESFATAVRLSWVEE